MEKMIFQKDNFKLLKSLYSSTLRPKKIHHIDESYAFKLLLINDIFFIIQKSIEAIIILQRKGNGSVIPVVARTVFENMVNLSLIVSESQVNGAERFFKFSEMSDLKIYNRYRQLAPGFVERVFTTEELDKAKAANDYFKLNKLSTKDWFGKNLYDSCEYLDRHSLKIIHVPGFFTLSYLQTYPFLSKSVHGQALHLENVSIARPKWPFTKFLFWNQTKNHEVTYLFHTIIAYLSALTYYHYFMGYEKEYVKYHNLLASRFGLVTNSLKVRDVALEEAGLKKMRRSIF